MAGAYCFACPSSPESPSSLLFSSHLLFLLLFMLFIFPSAAPVFMPTSEFHSSQWPLPDFLSLPGEIVTKPKVAVSSSFFLYFIYFVFCILYLYFSFFLFPFFPQRQLCLCQREVILSLQQCQFTVRLPTFSDKK